MADITPPAFEDQSSGLDAQPGSWLVTTINVLGTPMHLQAIRLADDEGEQRAYDPNLQSELENVYALYDDAAFETTEVPGFEGTFVLYAHPHGD